MKIEIRNDYIAHIKSLYLPGELPASTILDYYAKIFSLSSTDVSENLELVSEFFYLITKKACYNYDRYEDSEGITKFHIYEKSFVKAFEQIAKTNLPEHSEDKYICLLYFLNDLKNSTFAHFENTKLADMYDKFSDMLFDIRFIFGFMESKHKAYFQLNDILANFILSRDLLSNIDELETTIIKTLYLALEIFRITNNQDDLCKLNVLIRDCNLRFLKYRTQIEQNRGWENNYRANHVIVLCSFENGISKVLIRSNIKEYFGDCKNIEVEINGKGKAIGYFIESVLDEKDSLVSFKDEMKSREIGNRFQLTKLIFNNGYRNIFYSDYTLIKSPNGNIRPVNPFSKADTKLVFESNIIDVSNSHDFCNYLGSFNMSIVKGEILDFATFGLYIYLYKLNEDLLPEFVFNIWEKAGNCWQNTIIQEYIKAKPDKLPELLKSFNDTFIGDIDNRSIESVLICPIQLNLGEQINLYIKEFAPDNLGLESYPNTLVEALTLEGQNYFIHEKDNVIIPYSSINNIESSNCNLSNGIFVIQKCKEYYYVGDECNRIIQLNRIVAELNERLIPEQELKPINQIQVDSILKRMESQSSGLLEGLSLINCNQDDFFCIKILYHFFKFQILDSIKIQAFFSLYIDKIPWLSFDFLKSDKILASELINPSTLVVYKDSDRLTGNTCETVCKKYVVDSYRVESASYGAELRLWRNYYCYNNNKIKEILFIFDNTITGNSVIRALNFYLNGVDDSLMQYRYFYRTGSPDSKIIQVKDVIDRNSPKIKVRVMYYTADAKRKIEMVIAKFENENMMIDVEVLFDKQIQETSDNVYEKVELVYSDARYLDRKYRNNCLIIREINQPKKNWLRSDLYNKARVYSLFIKQDEKK
ncbi:hypothetical protein [uncultured Sphaerochaeta sp.]|uniref:hypothetical protein n=1 Tax=uncultured Sphaerochaeta sp. TaxID=886478 RepID=UPI002AA695B3|nr:hypothetical protein [uncultured Sphaerochaeta sp.]